MRRDDYHGELQSIVDRIMLNPDPAWRVNTLHGLAKHARRMLTDARGEAIYRLLQHNTQEQAQRLTGINRATLSVLASQWRHQHDRPPLPRRRRNIDLTNGIDMSGEPRSQSMSSDR